MLKNHKWYMEPRLVTVNDLYAFDPNAKVSIDPFKDIIGRHFKQPKEGLGNDNSPSAHMWRTLARPDSRSRLDEAPLTAPEARLKPWPTYVTFMSKRILCGIAAGVLLAVVASAQTAGKPPLPGLDATVTKVERAATASLRDCPPGSNTVNAIDAPGRAVRAGDGGVQGRAVVPAGADEAALDHRRRPTRSTTPRRRSSTSARCRSFPARFLSGCRKGRS